MSYYPIAIDLTGKKCLVVGGGNVAFRKARSLVDAGAFVTVISPRIENSFLSLPNTTVLNREYKKGDIVGYLLVFAATDNEASNKEIFNEAQSNGILVNVVDKPEICSFIVPSVMKRGDLMISVITSGKSPALSKRIRNELEMLYGPEYADYVAMLADARNKIKQKYTDYRDREAAINRIIESDVLGLLKKGYKDKAEARVEECI